MKLVDKRARAQYSEGSDLTIAINGLSFKASNSGKMPQCFNLIC